MVPNASGWIIYWNFFFLRLFIIIIMEWFTLHIASRTIYTDSNINWKHVDTNILRIIIFVFILKLKSYIHSHISSWLRSQTITMSMWFVRRFECLRNARKWCAVDSVTMFKCTRATNRNDKSLKWYWISG